jgi:hypothetical protein
MTAPRLRHFTLASNRRHEVHAIKGVHTLCGLNLAFAADPLETQAPVSCAVCVLKYPSVEPGHLPLNDADGDLLMSKVREYGEQSRRSGSATSLEGSEFRRGRANAAARDAAWAAYLAVSRLIRGSHTADEESPESDIEQATRHVAH